MAIETWGNEWIGRVGVPKVDHHFIHRLDQFVGEIPVIVGNPLDICDNWLHRSGRAKTSKSSAKAWEVSIVSGRKGRVRGLAQS